MLGDNEKIKLIKFDIIILDIMMPGKSGLEFISENKNNLLFINAICFFIFNNTC